MRRYVTCVLAAVVLAGIASAEMKTGNPQLRSMSVLEFGEDGTLFIGDSIGGQIVAVDFAGEAAGEMPDRVEVDDLEGRIAALLGTTADEIMIHDLAVHPQSLNAYVAVSRGRGKWSSAWELPNDVANANILLRIHPDGKMDEAELEGVRFDSVQLPNPVGTDKTHMWKEGAKLRTDTITDLVLYDGTLFATGLSNEEFASTMWRVDYPFNGRSEFSTLEVFHGAHGEWETHAPVRTFLPYELNGETQILASYLCTPLVTFSLRDLDDGAHVKGKTVAEFGSGNYPLDMVRCEYEGKEFIVLANSMLPLFTFDPQGVTDQDAIVSEVEGYTQGLSYAPKAANGIQQLDNFGPDQIVAVQRLPNGKLRLTVYGEQRLAL